LAAKDDDERQKWMEAIWNARNAALYTWDHYSSHPLYPNLPKASLNEENILNKLVSQENLIEEQQLPPKCNAVDVARTLVLPRLKVLNVIFTGATTDQLVDALQYYSPESRLIEQKCAEDIGLRKLKKWKHLKATMKGKTDAELLHILQQNPSDKMHDVEGNFESNKFACFQGELDFGDIQAFHGGAELILGQDIDEDSESERGVDYVEKETVMNGRMEDKYNLWYFKYCPAKTQNWYDENGHIRKKNEEVHKIVDANHGDLRLKDLTKKIITN
jgi:hypothetical protein